MKKIFNEISLPVEVTPIKSWTRKTSSTCLHCGISFMAKFQREEKYCSVECRNQNKHKQYENRGWNKKPESTCLQCGIKFISKSTRTGKYCSVKCRYEFNPGMTNEEQKLHKAVLKKQRDHDRKEKALEYKGGKCNRCGYNKCKAALEFHHIDPLSKIYTISHIFGSINWEILKEELDKCELLCANCHRETHWSLDES